MERVGGVGTDVSEFQAPAEWSCVSVRISQTSLSCLQRLQAQARWVDDLAALCGYTIMHLVHFYNK